MTSFSLHYVEHKRETSETTKACSSNGDGFVKGYLNVGTFFIDDMHTVDHVHKEETLESYCPMDFIGIPRYPNPLLIAHSKASWL
jgi:hypothetical protein